MKTVKLENINSHLKKKLKNKKFRANYEIERTKVALAQKMAELRQEKNLKQVDLARVLHVSQQFISQIETAQERNLTLDSLKKLAQAFKRDIVISFPKASCKISQIIVA